MNGVASVAAPAAGVLAGFAVGEHATALLWLDRAAGTWTDEPAIVRERLTEAANSAAARPVDPTALHDALLALTDPIRQRLGIAAGSRWSMPEPDAAARALSARLQPYVAAAARRRDAAALHRLEQTLRFLAGGHTAGERMAVERVLAAPPGKLLAEAARLPTRRPAAVSLEVRVVGLVLFEPE